VISKNKIMNDYFLQFPNKKESWFKSIIQRSYQSISGKIITNEELVALNKKTILTMIQTIHDETNKSDLFSLKPSPTVINTEARSSFLKPYSITENKVEKIGNQFHEKQAEYNTIFDKKVPESPDFTEKHDKPLSNMDELIKQHLQEREDELRKYTPLPLVQQPVHTQVIQPQSSNKLKIEQGIDTIHIQIEEIQNPSLDSVSETRAKKSVNWLDDSTTEKIQLQQKEIEILKQQIIELQERLSNLERHVETK